MTSLAATPAPITETQNPLLVFIHVPKTGGSSIQAILLGILMNSRPVFKIGDPQQAAEFLDMPRDEQDLYYSVVGHMPIGIDKCVDRPVIYMTFIRDPVERILSAYAHQLRHPSEPGADVARAQGVAWTANEANICVSLLADYDFPGPFDEQNPSWEVKWPMDEERLQQAKRNLENSAFIGLHEFYEQDVRRLSDLAGTRIIVPSILPREKVGHNRMAQDELTAEQIEAIRRANRLDVELYEHALHLRSLWEGPVNPAYRRKEVWLTLQPKWWVNDGTSEENTYPFPIRLRTPAVAWHYGALSEPLPITEPATLRITAELTAGAVGLCLLGDDMTELVSEQRVLTRGAGREAIFLNFEGGRPPRLCVRNYDGPGQPGEAIIFNLEICR